MDGSDINSLPPEVLTQVLKRLPLRYLIPLHSTSKLWGAVIQQLELTTRLMQEKFFFYNNEFIQVGTLTDENEVNWTKVFEARKRLPQAKRYSSLPTYLIDSSELTEERMGCNFPTIGPNIGIFSGCYYYEVKIIKSDILQLGWMTLDEIPDGKEGTFFFLFFSHLF